MIDATKAGVVGDGITLNTARIQKVIDDCAASGGGTIHFPAGRYLTGTIQIRSNITLRLHPDAVLLGSTDAVDCVNADPFEDAGGGEVRPRACRWGRCGKCRYPPGQRVYRR